MKTDFWHCCQWCHCCLSFPDGLFFLSGILWLLRCPACTWCQLEWSNPPAGSLDGLNMLSAPLECSDLLIFSSVLATSIYYICFSERCNPETRYVQNRVIASFCAVTLQLYKIKEYVQRLVFVCFIKLNGCSLLICRRCLYLNMRIVLLGNLKKVLVSKANQFNNSMLSLGN